MAHRPRFLHLAAAMLLLIAVVVATLLFSGARALRLASRRTREGRLVPAARLLVLGGALGAAALLIELAGARQIASSQPLAVALVGLHTAHVGAALALTLWVLGLIRSERTDRRHHTVVAGVTAYWYFVACVWVLVWLGSCA